MKDRQHSPVGDRIEELVGMPRRSQGARFRFTIADNAGNHKMGVVEHSPKSVAEGITQLAAFMDRSGALRRCVAGNSPGKGKLEEELPQSGLILTDIWIYLAICAFKVRVGNDSWAPVPGAGDVNHV